VEDTRSLKSPDGFNAALAFVKRQPTPGGESVAAANSLGLGLLSSLAGHAHDETIAISPAGLVTALAMIAHGARGATAGALTAALGNDPDSIEDMLGEAEPDQDPWDRAVTVFGGLKRAGDVPFLCPESTDWHAVSDFAGGGADTIISSRFDAQTRALLRRPVTPAEAITVINPELYFKASWRNAFDPALTEPGTFERSPLARPSVPMMRREGTFKYCEAPSFQAVCLPFIPAWFTRRPASPGAGAYEGLIVLGRDGQDAGDVLAGLTFAARKGTLTLPRLSLNGVAVLAEPLRENGLAAMVNPDADFSGLRDPGFRLDSICQLVWLGVDESGVHTGMQTRNVKVMRKRRAMVAGEETPFTLLVNRPFLFAIRHRLTGLLIFAARVCDPRTKAQQQDEDTMHRDGSSWEKRNH
jgi:serpin B